jgi:hypothetical protein
VPRVGSRPHTDRPRPLDGLPARPFPRSALARHPADAPPPKPQALRKNGVHPALATNRAKLLPPWLSGSDSQEPAPAYPTRSADHHAASSEGIACETGARAPDCGGSCRHPGSGWTTPESSCRHG